MFKWRQGLSTTQGNWGGLEHCYCHDEPWVSCECARWDGKVGFTVDSSSCQDAQPRNALDGLALSKAPASRLRCEEASQSALGCECRAGEGDVPSEAGRNGTPGMRRAQRRCNAGGQGSARRWCLGGRECDRGSSRKSGRGVRRWVDGAGRVWTWCRQDGGGRALRMAVGGLEAGGADDEELSGDVAEGVGDGLGGLTAQ